MKHIIAVLFLSFMFIVNSVHAETVSTVKENLIDSLSQSGYLDKDKTVEVKNKFISKEDKTRQVVANTVSPDNEKTWHKYVTWINLFKILGILLILVAMGKFIKKVVKKLLFIFISIPLIVYQIAILALSLTFTFLPSAIHFWLSETVYIVLLGALSNIAIISWIIAKNKYLSALFNKLMGKDDVLIGMKISFISLIYFGYFTITLPSYIFGFLSVASFSIFMITTVLWIISKLKQDSIKENDFTLSVVFCHLLALIGYTAFSPTYDYFTPAVQYLFSLIVLGVLILNTLPEIQSKMKGFYFVFFTAIMLISVYSYTHFDTKLISTLVFTGYYILVFTWLAYHTFKANMILGLMSVGLFLYGSALLLEKYGSYLMFSSF